ncbi:MMPL family transporter [Haloarchaeobius sp. HME9146]|uniref:MMPL family transporter n=1 Tax=Haloarchaeobius sp. HME9146 TaxID=2978732 RepID=UPI0021C163E4|nr:MMPL family transporter [Haloarchaeobius sp. HME9146]MCT9094784.1 MMPL family transporter [Haloarchaeobius sp. HME9146]
MSRPSLPGHITEYSRHAIAVVLILTLVVGAGVPAMEQSTSLEQYQGGTAENDALDYLDANFSAGDGNTTVAQIIVEGDDVLSKESLVETLSYQQALRANETVNGTVGEDGIRSVAGVVATTAIAEERAADLQERQQELNETNSALREELAKLEANPNASASAAFASVDANSSVNLTATDQETFENATRQLRNASNESQRQAAYQLGTQGVLADEYDALREDRASLESGIDPTLAEQQTQLESMNESSVEDVVSQVLGGDTGGDGSPTNAPSTAQMLRFMPAEYEPGSTEANGTLLLVSQQTDVASFAPGDAPAEIVDSELAMQELADSQGGDLTYLVFGDGIVAHEVSASMDDSIAIVGPLAFLFVLVVLTITYRDLLDVVLGLGGVVTVLVWTFGVMGWTGIAFNQMFIMILVLLIGLSIDYAIHVVMRYREELGDDPDAGPLGAMRTSLATVGGALVLVTTTTVVGFLSNLTSPIGTFRTVGVVAAVGIASALLVFGVLVPAVKLELDTWLESRGWNRQLPAFGTGGGRFTEALRVGELAARRAPVVILAVALLLTAAGAYGGTQVETSFSQEDFLADDPAEWMQDLPDALAPGDYQAQEAMSVLNDRFVREDSKAQILVTDDVTNPETLDRLADAADAAAEKDTTSRLSNGEAAIDSPVSTFERVAAENESFAATLNAADTDDDGLPDENVSLVYDQLYRVAPDQAGDTVYRTDSGEYEALRLVVSVDGDADGETVMEQMRDVADIVDGDGAEAVATGQVIVDQLTQEQLLTTVLRGLVISLVVVTIILMLAYRLTEGSASLGAVTVLPVAFTLAWILGTMHLLDIPFNVVTGLITSLTIGMGVDYSVHVSERYNHELAELGSAREALDAAVTGTGGALASSAATTAGGFGVLTVAILPFLQQFGFITALTIVYAFVASVVVLPSLLVLWTRFAHPETLGSEANDAEQSESEEPAVATATGLETVDAERTASHPEPLATRSLDQTHVRPGQTLRVHLAVEATDDQRLVLRDRVVGTETALVDVSPEPTQAMAHDGVVFVAWDGAGDGERRCTYETTIPQTASDGDTARFVGAIETAAGETHVAGDDSVHVVSDLFERVVSQGHATDADLAVAATAYEQGQLTAAQFERLTHAWLRVEGGMDEDEQPARLRSSAD